MIINESEYNHEEVEELFQVVFKLSAKDINDKLIKVRNRPEIAKRRWFWELLQNAKDSVKKTEKVDVKVKVSQTKENIPYIAFSHNGNPFRYEDAKNLIFPYSDKEDENNSDNTGRFGTGFLATHILSKKIHVKGVYIKNQDAYNFVFILDRSATDKTELANSINQTWHGFRTKREPNPEYKYCQENYDTHFVYPLTLESLKEVNEAIEDLQNSLPFTLAFIPKVRSVQFEDTFTKKRVIYSSNELKLKPLSGELKEIIIEKQVFLDEQLTENKDISIVVCSDGKVEVAAEILRGLAEDVILKGFQEHHPKLFCSFPLIGANDFPFPIVINSEMFTPKEERDGIWLGNTNEGLENQKLIEGAIPLFQIIVRYVSELKWGATYELFRTLKDDPTYPDMDVKWYSEIIQKPLKESLLSIPLVDNPEGERKAAKDINFPYYNKEEVRNALWTILYDFNRLCVPLKPEVHLWYDVLWSGARRISLESLVLS